MAEPKDDPSTPSLAHEALSDSWQMIRDIREGAVRVKEEGDRYLPQFGAEDGSEYERRKRSAPWRPEFEDALRSISAKPFAKAVALAGEPSEAMTRLSYDIDGRGNNLHTFARDLFEDGVALGLAGIFVDYPSMEKGATLADERRVGARPYWAAVAADEILALRTERVGSDERITHLRLRETVIVTEGFAETEIEQIRVIEPGKWETYRQNDNDEWVLAKEGVLSLQEVPFALFATADRRGAQYVRPPLLDLAEMQIELYRFMSNEEQIYTMAGSPMLTANGMDEDPNRVVEIGPSRILYAPGVEGIQTGWDYIQPDAANLEAITNKAKSIIEDMRRLGMQPMLPKSGSFTATGQSIEAAKAHSAVQSWALDLKDCLERAFGFTAEWMGSSEVVEVSVNTDFAIGVYGEAEVTALNTAKEKGFISLETWQDEMARRGVLGPQFDKEQEAERLIAEAPGLEPGEGESEDDELREAAE